MTNHGYGQFHRVGCTGSRFGVYLLIEARDRDEPSIGKGSSSLDACNDVAW